MRKLEAKRAREFLLILDKGDDVGSTLLDFAKRNAIGAASFFSIGALREATIAYWNAETNKYEDIPVREQVEVVSMIGNITPSAQDLKLHAHILLGKRDGSTVAGHFRRGIAYPTLEVFLTARDAKVQRAKDEATGLWLLEPMT